MRPQTKAAIEAVIRDDPDYAKKLAYHEVNTTAHPAQWALDIVGPKISWRHLNSTQPH